MLSKIELTNFQSHDASSLEFHPGVNAIVGPSDKGKSAILRAIYWVWTNRPTGVSVVSDWARDAKGNLTGECSVRLESSRGCVQRIRTKDVNGYSVNGVSLEAVGVSVPDEVGSILNLGDVNVQRQMDAPFLLGSSPGEVARFLNSTVKLDAIDEALSLVESRKRKTKSEATEARKRATEAQALIDSMAWVEAAEVIADELERLEPEKAQKMEARRQLWVSLDIYATESNTCQELAELPRAFALLEEVRQSIQSRSVSDANQYALGSSIQRYRAAAADTIVGDVEGIESGLAAVRGLLGGRDRLQSRYDELRDQIQSYKESLRELGGRKLPDATPLIQELRELRRRANDLSEKQSALGSTLRDYRDQSRIEGAQRQEIRELTATKRKLEEELKASEPVELRYYWHSGSDYLFAQPSAAPPPNDDGNVDEIGQELWNRKARELYP